MRVLLAPMLLAVVTGCAAGQSDSEPSGGAGGEGATTASTTGVSTSTHAASTSIASSSSGGCAQDCSTVPVQPCYESVCNQATHACELKVIADGEACEDGLFCTVDDTCESGVCQSGSDRVCPGSADACLMAECDEEADACGSTPAPNGTSCTPLDLCQDAGGAICQNGTCIGAPKDCSGVALPDDCSVPGCDAGTGTCIPVNAPDGVSCLIGQPCEADKTCTAGVCSGTPIAGCTLCLETEANNTVTTANHDAACTGYEGHIGVIGDKDYYQIDVTIPDAHLKLATVDLDQSGCPAGFDSVLRLYDATGALVTENDQSETNSPCSSIDIVDRPVGTYFAAVEEKGNDATSPPYLLTFEQAAPVCGNGVIEGNEECDDGNLVGSDGCSSTCTLGLCLGGQRHIYHASDVPQAIPDNPAPGITSIINVPTMANVTRVTVILNVSHTHDGDLFITLTPPDAAAVTLADNVGVGGNDFADTMFASNATVPISSGAPPFHGYFVPSTPLTPVLNTAGNGNWTLSIADQFSNDVGTLNAWTLVTCTP